MKKAITFIKKNALSIVLTCGVIVFPIYVFLPFSLEILYYVRVIGCLIFTAWVIYKGRNEWAVIKYQDKNKNLTAEDVHNILFVKSWEEIRERGIWSYCIKDGAIILGAGLALLLSILTFIIIPGMSKYLMEDPGNMFSFIGYTYLAGAITGVAIHRILWPYKQHRFMKLTDPLNDKYSQELFLDQ